VNAVAARSPRCGIDSVEVARVERMLADTPAADLSALFSADELRDAGDGPGRAGSLAARLAAKEACLKLFPRETALNTIAAPDFSVVRDVWGAPEVVCSPTAEAVRNRHRIARITLSMTHDRTIRCRPQLGDVLLEIILVLLEPIVELDVQRRRLAQPQLHSRCRVAAE